MTHPAGMPCGFAEAHHSHLTPIKRRARKTESVIRMCGMCGGQLSLGPSQVAHWVVGSRMELLRERGRESERCMYTSLYVSVSVSVICVSVRCRRRMYLEREGQGNRGAFAKPCA